MKRMKWCLLCWLVLSVVSHHITCKNNGQNQDLSQNKYHRSDEDKSQHSDCSDENRSQRSDRSGEDRSQSSDHSDEYRVQRSKRSNEDGSKGSKCSDKDGSQGSKCSDKDGSQGSKCSDEDESQGSKCSDKDGSQSSKCSDEDESQGSECSDEDGSKGSKCSDKDGSKGSKCSDKDGSKGSKCSDKDGSQGSECSDEDESQGSKCSDKDGSQGSKNPQKICQGGEKPGRSDAKCCMEQINSILKNGNRHNSFKAIEELETFLEETEVIETTTLLVDHLVALLHRPKGPFKGTEIYASENEARPDEPVMNSKVSVQLPRELDVGSNNTIIIVFCMITLPEQNMTELEAAEELYESRLVGLSVRGKNISGLQEHVNFTMKFTMGINVTQEPSCVFLNFSTQAYSNHGCLTIRNQSHITCSCNHLTYFGVLMVSADLSTKDQKIQTYITLIGCSISLFALVLTLLLFITNKKVRADVSMKVHINLAIALILLNVHFLPSHAVAALPSTGLCLYMALALHYSLLATFSWMALEGFHLYLLLVKVFNIYIRRYLLKLSVLGWGIPVVIVSLVVIIDRDAYGLVPVNSNSTAMQEKSGNKFANICYIANDTVKMVTTVGVFCLVFAFNVVMLGVMVKRVLSLHQRQEFGQKDRDRAKRDICTLLGITILLGIPWGMIFFSLGTLPTAGLYLFAILNSLQGFFIFLWFLLSLRKTGRSGQPAKTSTETRSTSG